MDSNDAKDDNTTDAVDCDCVETDCIFYSKGYCTSKFKKVNPPKNK